MKLVTFLALVGATGAYDGCRGWPTNPNSPLYCEACIRCAAYCPRCHQNSHRGLGSALVDDKLASMTSWLVGNCSCRRILFVHVPKTGGSSVLQYFHSNPVLSALLLRPPQPDLWHWHHVTAEKQRSYYGEETWRDALKLGGVRNPFALFVSSVMYARDYGCKARIRPSAEVCNLLNESTDLAENLEAFAQYLSSKPSAMDDIFPMMDHFPPATQRDWLYDSKTNLNLMDRIIHLENEDEFGPVSGRPNAAFLNSLCSAGAGTSWVNQTLPDKTRHACKDVLLHALSPRAEPEHRNAQEHGDPFDYLSADMCAFIVRWYGNDFSEFGYNASECAARVARATTAKTPPRADD